MRSQCPKSTLVHSSRRSKASTREAVRGRGWQITPVINSEPLWAPSAVIPMLADTSTSCKWFTIGPGWPSTGPHARLVHTAFQGLGCIGVGAFAVSACGSAPSHVCVSGHAEGDPGRRCAVVCRFHIAACRRGSRLQGRRLLVSQICQDVRYIRVLDTAHA